MRTFKNHVAWQSLILVACASVWCSGVQAQSTPGVLTPTPPMGWNSWDSYGLSITEPEFRENAEWMARHLKQYGWNYAVVDEGWYLQNPDGKAGTFRFAMDTHGRYTPALNRFPSAGNDQGFRPLADWVHQQGLKFGIHIIRGIPREAVNKDLRIADSQYRAAEAANKSDTCAWNSDNYGVKYTPAGQQYYDSIATLYASWRVDFVKIDCISSPYISDEIHMFSEALRKTGRPIVLSLSPGPTPLDKIDDLRKYAQMWRISGDVWDHWKQWPNQDWSQGLLGQFQLAAKWAQYVEPGHWPDADMLPLGYLGPRPGQGKARLSNLTPDEERTMITLWAIFRSPLIIGGNLMKSDSQTASLLTNPEVIAVDQHSHSARPVVNDAKKAAWIAKPDSGGGAYIALFNLGDAPQTVAYPLQSVGLSGTSFTVRDLWEHKGLGNRDQLKVDLSPHASALYRITATK
jgi:hypothetical protein